MVHVHKYGLKKLGKKKQYEVMACQLPLCPHYVVPTLAIGKMSICFRCDEQFVLTPNDIKFKPACYDCIQSAKPNGGYKDSIDTIKDALDLEDVED